MASARHTSSSSADSSGSLGRAGEAFRASSFVKRDAKPIETIQGMARNFECFVERVKPADYMSPTQGSPPDKAKSPLLTNQQQIEIPSQMEFSELISRKTFAEVQDIATELYTMMQRIYFMCEPERKHSHVHLTKHRGKGLIVDPSLGSLKYLQGGESDSGSSIQSGSTGNAVITKQGGKETDELGFECIANYMLEKEVGQGRYGTVYLAIGEDNQQFAIKAMRKNMSIAKILRRASVTSGQNDQGSQSFEEESQDVETSIVMREIAIMKKLRHKNIVQLHEVIFDEEEDMCYLVMQYVSHGPIVSQAADGSCTPLEERLVKKYIRQAASGLEYLHNHRVIHRDIKPDNILIGDDETAYLADFGVSEVINTGKKRVGEVQAGTIPFFSPELSTAEDTSVAAEYGKQSDIWALGVTMYLLLFGKLPFVGQTLPAMMNAIINKPLRFPDDCDPSARDVLEGLLEKDPEKRWTLKQLRRHPYFGAESQETILDTQSFRLTEEDMKNAVRRKTVMLLPSRRRMTNTATDALKEFLKTVGKGSSITSLVPTNEEPSYNKTNSGGSLVASGSLSPKSRVKQPNILNTGVKISPKHGTVSFESMSKIEKNDVAQRVPSGSAFSVARFKRGNSGSLETPPPRKRTSVYADTALVVARHTETLNLQQEAEFSSPLLPVSEGNPLSMDELHIIEKSADERSSICSQGSDVIPPSTRKNTRKPSEEASSPKRLPPRLKSR